MYIAFKWLLGLGFTMWLGMCALDMYFKNTENIFFAGLRGEILTKMYKNCTTIQKDALVQRKDTLKTQPNGVSLFHYLMFVAGGVAVSLYNRKQEILFYLKSQATKMDITQRFKNFYRRFKITATNISTVSCVAAYRSSKNTWKIITMYLSKIRNMTRNLKTRGLEAKRQKLNVLLMKRLKEVGDEKKNMGQLLLAAIRENRNIRSQYQLETLAKERLKKHVEDTQKFIKESRSKYVNFQQLYLATHQDNIFLKARIKKLSKAKDEAERNLMTLVNEVYLSKNNELKSFCSRFVVRTKDNLLSANVTDEIEKFLHKSRGSMSTVSGNNLDEILRQNSSTRITELAEDEISVATLVSDAPRLKGLPGEYVWTVKDKNGLIEKLYEYDYGSDYDNGDTIRRIREYSVYFDKDCLLDRTNSATLLSDGDNANQIPRYPLAGHNFLTGSEAFRTFLENNTSITHFREISTN